MKVEKMTVSKNDILKINPLNNKKISDGYRGEIADKADALGFIDYKLDTKINTKFGDYRQGNYIKQTKTRRCQISLVKNIPQVVGFIEVLDMYIKYSKANRYNYIVTIDDISYRIVMNKKEFKEFVIKFGTYSKSRNHIRIWTSDNVIYKWAIAQ
jgi:hypothetical protein